MRSRLCIISLLVCLWIGTGFPGLGWMPTAIAAPLSRAPIEVQVHLSNSDNELKFFPDTVSFIPGKRYKLVLDNPSTKNHYFTAKDFADVIWTQKLEAGHVQVKGVIHDLELEPGAIAEWLFIPIKPGTYKLRCTATGHTEAGMVGQLEIAAR